MKIVTTTITLTLVTLLSAMVAGTSCSGRSTDEACYPASEELADPTDPSYEFEYPLCGIRWDQVDYPDAPNDNGDWIAISVCEDLEPGGRCDLCAVDEIDTKILAHAQGRVDEAAQSAEPEGCDVPVTEIFRGCVATPENQRPEEEPECCYRAWVWTACNIGGVPMN